MEKMKLWKEWFFRRCIAFHSMQTGEVNIIAMVLIIIVVIALVAIFRSEMTDIVNKLFEKIRTAMEV